MGLQLVGGGATPVQGAPVLLAGGAMCCLFPTRDGTCWREGTLGEWIPGEIDYPSWQNNVK